MEIESTIIAVIGIFAVVLVILAFGNLYGGEWQATAQNVSTVAVAIVVFMACIGGIAYWRK